MQSRFKKWNAAFLILLFIGSFILHPLVHGSAVCRHEELADRLTAESVHTARCLPAEAHCSAAEIFCPVCAGWLSAECPARFGFEPVRRDLPTVIAEAETSDAAPCLRLPSPRAPPAI